MVDSLGNELQLLWCPSLALSLLWVSVHRLMSRHNTPCIILHEHRRRRTVRICSHCTRIKLFEALLLYLCFFIGVQALVILCVVLAPAAGGSLNKWFLDYFQSSISTSKTDAIHWIHYQSTVDAIRVSQQPLNVYQVQLRPIKPIRHHNVSRHRDEGRAHKRCFTEEKW